MDLNINNIITILISPELQEKLLLVKIAFLAISLFFLGFIIFAIFKTHYFEWLYLRDFTEFFTFRPFGAKKINKTWNKILKRLETGVESEYKLAVVEADNMLDNSLKKMGYSGQTMEEKLEKLTSATLPNIEQVYQAHKMRNNIVHNPDHILTLDEAKKTLDIYDQTFQHLQILT